MRRGIAISFVLLTALWAAAPLLACMVPGRAMTAPERHCCTHMAQMCGSSNMPQSHSCCKTKVRSSSTMLATSKHESAPQLQLIATVSDAAVAPLYETALENRPHHPPGEFLPETTVLRI